MRTFDDDDFAALAALAGCHHLKARLELYLQPGRPPRTVQICGDCGAKRTRRKLQDPRTTFRAWTPWSKPARVEALVDALNTCKPSPLTPSAWRWMGTGRLTRLLADVLRRVAAEVERRFWDDVDASEQIALEVLRTRLLDAAWAAERLSERGPRSRAETAVLENER